MSMSQVKRLPTVRGTRVQSLGQEHPLEKEMATHSSILAWGIPMDRGTWLGYSPWGRKESDTTERLSLQHEHAVSQLCPNPRKQALVLFLLKDTRVEPSQRKNINISGSFGGLINEG